MKAFLCTLAVFVSIQMAAQNPIPFLNQPLVPSSVRPGASAFSLSVNGTGFVPLSVVNWNGSPRTTHFVNASHLTAQITSTDVVVASTTTVTVSNPAPGGGTSNANYFAITSPRVVPSFSALIAAAAHGGGAIVAGDFNGDGKLDLAAIDESKASSLVVLLGNGNGTFSSPINSSLPQTPAQLAIGDFDGDGKLDIALSENPGNQVEVLLGRGDGSFQSAQSFSAGAGPGAGILAADLNGDGKLDLAVVSEGEVSTLLGNGDGTFQPPLEILGFNTPSLLAVGDFNNDGMLDLAVTTNGTSSVSILLGNGDGTFTSGAELITSRAPAYVVAGDFNGDGKLDIAVTDSPGTLPQRGIRIFVGNGDGTFQNGVEYPSNADYQQMITTDVNGDGMLDLVAAVSCCDAHPGTAAILLGNGDGTFQGAKFYPASGNAFGVAAGDFFNDGRTDLALSGGPLGAGENVAVLLQASATLLPGTLQFQTSAVGTDSAAQSSTLTNIGNGPLLITGRAVKGSNPSDFTESDNCPTSLAQGAKCTISVAFAPTSDGVRSAAVSIAVSGTPKLPAITLKGTGTFAGLTPSNLNFGSQSVGSTSAPQTVTLTNLSTTQTFKSVAIGVFGTDHFDFGFVTNTCGRTLAPGASCNVGVVFTPQTTGSRSAHLKVQLSGTPIPIPVTLTGTGTP